MSKLFKKVFGITLGLALCFGFSFSCSNKQSNQMARAEAAITTNGNVITYTFGAKADIGTDTIWHYTSGAPTGYEADRGVAWSKSATTIEYTATCNVSNVTIDISANETGGSVKVNNITKQTVSKGSHQSKSFDVSIASGETITIVTEASAKSIWIKSISLTGDVGGATVEDLEVLDYDANVLRDGDEVDLDASSALSVSTNITCGVTYSDSTSDGNVDISSNPSSNFSCSTEDHETYTLRFTMNCDYMVTIAAHADDNYSITITYHVTGIPSTEYELFTDKFVSGDYVFMSADSKYSHVMGNSISNNRVANGTSPSVEENKIINPSDAYVWHIERSGEYWTIQNSANEKYLCGTSNDNQAALLDSITDNHLALWSISYSSGWVFHNLGRSESGSKSDKAYLRNNGDYGWACYTSSTGNGVALFKLPSTDPCIAVEATEGSTSLGVDDTVTLGATLFNTEGIVTWSLVDNSPSDSGNVVEMVVNGNEVTITGKKDGTVKVRASFTNCDDADTLITVTKALSFITVTTAPTKTTYTEGELFSTDGMVVTATYDDGSTSTPNDFVYYPNVALTPFDTAITVSYNGKSTTQEITVNSKTVSNIDIKLLPLKTVYHADDEFDPFGLEISVTYSDSDTADINSGFEISPSAYTFTSADEVLGSKTFTVTYGGKSTTFDVTVSAISGPLSDGRYYIMNGNKSLGLNANICADASPAGVDLSVSNALTAFDIELKDDNGYEISTTIDGTKYYLVCNTTQTTKSNTSIRITSNPSHSLVSLLWSLDASNRSADGSFLVGENTVEGITRYLACFESGTSSDWRGYVADQGDKCDIQFVPEGYYANQIVASILSNEEGQTLCNGGSDAPSTDLWDNIANITHIENELAILRDTDAAVKDSYGNTPDGTDAEKAMARYDEIMVKYNTQSNKTYEDFLGRIEAQNLILRQSLSNNLFNLDLESSDGSSMVIIVFSLIGLTACAGFFLLKKRKEHTN